MMRTSRTAPAFLLTALFTLCLAPATAQSRNVKIIESQNFFGGHDMDQEWLNVSSSFGWQSSIESEALLDGNSYYASTDILIVSSGVNQLSQNRVNNIRGFLTQGGNVYLQGEYLTTYSSNQAFSYLVSQLGGSFTWNATTSGDLIPMDVVGTLSGNLNQASPLSYFWYGANGQGNHTIEPFLVYQDLEFGWVFTPPNSNHGLLVHSTDQDWVRATTSVELMENILFLLSASGPNLTVLNLVSGGNTTISVRGATPGGVVGVGYSPYGGGPSSFTTASCGVLSVDLTPPVRLLPLRTAGANGSATWTLPVPPGTTGVNVFFHGLDVASCTLTNSVAQVIG